MHEYVCKVTITNIGTAIFNATNQLFIQEN